MKPTRKLPDLQKRVIGKMREGYELGQYNAFIKGTRLQIGGFGLGGATSHVTASIKTALEKKGIIEVSEKDFRLTKYKLTELGKTINIEQ